VTPSGFPWLRWAVAAFLAVYVPGYALAYGLANFLFYWLQSAIAVFAVPLGRLFGPAANINYAYVEPLLKRT
jgi:hypothetical protein